MHSVKLSFAATATTIAIAFRTRLVSITLIVGVVGGFVGEVFIVFTSGICILAAGACYRRRYHRKFPIASAMKRSSSRISQQGRHSSANLTSLQAAHPTTSIFSPSDVHEPVTTPPAIVVDTPIVYPTTFASVAVDAVQEPSSHSTLAQVPESLTVQISRTASRTDGQTLQSEIDSRLHGQNCHTGSQDAATCTLQATSSFSLKIETPTLQSTEV